MKKQEKIDYSTGEIIEQKFEQLNQVIIKETIRPNGTIRLQQDFSNCPTRAEQHTAHLTDINYLIQRYKPDELAAYIAAKSKSKQEIIGHDFSKEPDLQGAKNIIYKSKQQFEALDPKIRDSFKNHVEFLKFIDNPANAEKMVQLGLLTKKQVTDLQTPEKDAAKVNDVKDARSKDAKE